MKNINDLLSQTLMDSSAQAGQRFADGGEAAILPVANGLDTLGAIDVEAKTRSPGKGERVVKLKSTSLEILQKRTAQALLRHSEGEQRELGFGIEQWTQDRRGVPNPLIRGGLFTTRLSANRETFKGLKIASLSNSNVIFSGEELRQDDLSCWMSIVNKGRDLPTGAQIFFTAYELIKDMRWRMHVESYVRLRGCIERLKFTSVKVASKDDKAAYAGSLIRDYEFDATNEDGKPRWSVRLEPSVVKLFINDNTTLVEWEQRKLIGTRASLTLWLHTFYSSHREPIPFGVAKLHELCRSDDKRLTNFKARLRTSMETLISIGFLRSYAITNDMVHVTRARHQERLSS